MDNIISGFVFFIAACTVGSAFLFGILVLPIIILCGVDGLWMLGKICVAASCFFSAILTIKVILG